MLADIYGERLVYYNCTDLISCVEIQLNSIYGGRTICALFVVEHELYKLFKKQLSKVSLVKYTKLKNSNEYNIQLVITKKEKISFNALMQQYHKTESPVR